MMNFGAYLEHQAGIRNSNAHENGRQNVEMDNFNLTAMRETVPVPHDQPHYEPMDIDLPFRPSENPAQ